jgi:hypothetical protein
MIPNVINDSSLICSVVFLVAGHTPFFDLDDCDFNTAMNALKKLQIEYNLSDIYVTSDKDRSFRAWFSGQ